mmetsp:Transcript_9827/g.44616  ORF Transcript_9827/g.44616 Transcript_9827/m.44616 type:complete len:86 (+) Transcript_9827:2026-2283(+)
MSAFLMTAFRSDMFARFEKSGIYVTRFHKKRLYAPSPSIFGLLTRFQKYIIVQRQYVSLLCPDSHVDIHAVCAVRWSAPVPRWST